LQLREGIVEGKELTKFPAVKYQEERYPFITSEDSLKYFLVKL
jgi:hypothetical protein